MPKRHLRGVRVHATMADRKRRFGSGVSGPSTGRKSMRQRFTTTAIMEQSLVSGNGNSLFDSITHFPRRGTRGRKAGGSPFANPQKFFSPLATTSHRPHRVAACAPHRVAAGTPRATRAANHQPPASTHRHTVPSPALARASPSASDGPEPCSGVPRARCQSRVPVGNTDGSVGEALRRPYA